jgi:ABC-2 type transport system ATP-binding protein
VGLDDVSRTVQEGEIFAIPGPGGAGQTSTVECIQAQGTLGGGRVSVRGLNPTGERSEPRQRLGGRLQDSQLPERLGGGRRAPAVQLVTAWPADHAIARPNWSQIYP